MRKLIGLRHGIAMLIMLLLLQGCSMLSSNRNGDDWLELVHAGLTAEDDFRFTGSVAMGFQDGPDLTPYSFEGTITGHHQVALHAQQSSNLVRNPINELDFIVKNYDQANILYDGLDDSRERHIVVLEVHATEAAATKRITDQLQEEMANVTLQAISQAEMESKQVEKVTKEANLATEELDQMLKSLQANLTYTLTIDALSAKPLKMDENMIMNYEKKQSVLSEYRKTAIIFDMSGYTK